MGLTPLVYLLIFIPLWGLFYCCKSFKDSSKKYEDFPPIDAPGLPNQSPQITAVVRKNTSSAGTNRIGSSLAKESQFAASDSFRSIDNIDSPHREYPLIPNFETHREINKRQYDSSKSNQRLTSPQNKKI